ncbi:hypothetical protein, partial [Agromyces humi]|uniref:hypothetical protein n=1 Tax=Agromyces humi TaxID=1766800 RepID=UPI00193ACDAF
PGIARRSGEQQRTARPNRRRPDGTIGIVGATARVNRSDAHSMVRWTVCRVKAVDEALTEAAYAEA